MLDLSNVKAYELPKEKKFLECEDGYFTINELWTIKIYKQNDTAPEDLKSKQQEVLELESQYENKRKSALELSEIKEDLRKAESELNYMMEPYHLQKTKCRNITEWNFEKWKELAGDRKTNTVYSIAYATWWRSDDADPDTFIETERNRE